MQHAAVRSVEPLARDIRTVRDASGTFHTGRRPLTPLVAGTIRIPRWLILATIDGGAKRLEVNADCGHRYRGPERAGVVSIVPPHCERRLQLYEVSSRWSSIEIDASLVDRTLEAAGKRLDARCVSNIEDPFLSALLGELTRTCLDDGSVDETYFDALVNAATHHLARRYSHGRELEGKHALARWQVARIEEYVRAHLDRSLRIEELANVSGLSEGYFHRAFRRTFGMTPLEFVNRARVRRAKEIWEREPFASVMDVALQVGYTSPSYFARTFRRIAGVNPTDYARRLAASAKCARE
jgi:AraC-type DNA-binding domain-containing proteins